MKPFVVLVTGMCVVPSSLFPSLRLHLSDSKLKSHFLLVAVSGSQKASKQARRNTKLDTLKIIRLMLRFFGGVASREKYFLANNSSIEKKLSFYGLVLLPLPWISFTFIFVTTQ
jgi:hypothetical protein